MVPKVCAVKAISFSRKKSSTLACVVVPLTKQIDAWLMLNTEVTPESFATMKPCPS
jgi:hypothetical protein